MAKKRLDPESEAAMEVVEMENKRMTAERLERENRERMLAKAYEMSGQIRAADMFSKFAGVSGTMWMKQMKDSGLYKEIPGIANWEAFCDFIGISRSIADEKILNLKTLGEEFLALAPKLNVGYRDLRKLRMLTNNNTITIDAANVTIADETIPLDPDHAEDIQAAIEMLIDAKEKELMDARATVKAKEKVLADKEKIIHRQETQIARMEGTAATKGLIPEEEALIRKLDNARMIIDDFFIQFDPERNPLPENATPRMKAKLMHTLDYFKRVTIAAFDTAGELYGEPEIDDDWVQPNLRVVKSDKE